MVVMMKSELKETLRDFTFFSTSDIITHSLHLCVFHSLSARGRKKAHHLHGQLKPLEVMFQVFSLHCEAVLQNREQQPGGSYQADYSC